MKRVLDVTSGSRMIWFDKENQDALFTDQRYFSDVLCDGRQLHVKPDVIADFRDLPFDNDSFYMVVFDPPHLKQAGENSWLAKKYGVLTKEWKEDISKGFSECIRVLKKNGSLIFKWNEEQVSYSDVKECFSIPPLFGQRRGKTVFVVFMK